MNLPLFICVWLPSSGCEIHWTRHQHTLFFPYSEPGSKHSSVDQETTSSVIIAQDVKDEQGSHGRYQSHKPCTGQRRVYNSCARAWS